MSSIWIYKNKYTKQGSCFVLERIYYGMIYSIDQTHFSSEAEVYIEQRNTCVEKDFVRAQKVPIDKHIQLDKGLEDHL